MAEPAPPADSGADPALDDSALNAALAHARAQGWPARDPVRWRRIDALAQRAAHHGGATRQLLDGRLQALLDESGQAIGAQAEALTTPAESPGAQRQARPLRSLLAQLQGTDAAGEASANNTGASSPARDLKVVHQHRAAWTQLRSEQRVAQSQTALPDQAGPLNSQLLLHRALTLMRETAPGYLQHLMGQADALMWLEQAQAAPAPESKAAAKAPARGRTAAKKPLRNARR